MDSNVQKKTIDIHHAMTWAQDETAVCISLIGADRIPIQAVPEILEYYAGKIRQSISDHYSSINSDNDSNGSGGDTSI